MWSNVFNIHTHSWTKNENNLQNRYTRLFFSVIVILFVVFICVHNFFVLCCWSGCCFCSLVMVFSLSSCMLSCVCVSFSFSFDIYINITHRPTGGGGMYSQQFLPALSLSGLFELWDGLHILVTYALHVNLTHLHECVCVSVFEHSRRKRIKLGIIKNLKLESRLKLSNLSRFCSAQICTVILLGYRCRCRLNSLSSICFCSRGRWKVHWKVIFYTSATFSAQ